MKKLLLAVVCIIALALYLNIGWTVATYYDSLAAGRLETFWQKAFAGWGEILAVPAQDGHINSGDHEEFGKTGDDINTLRAEKWMTSFVAWPVILFFALATWGAWLVWHILWLIFAGGLAKLLGLG